MLMSRRLIAAITGILALVHLTAWAGSPTERLRPAIEEVIRILDDPSLKPPSRAEERQARVRAAVEDLFDWPDMGQRVLGLHWRALTEPEREEFIDLFRALLARTYLPKIALYQGERVRFVVESVEADLATVQSAVVTPGGKEAAVSYRLRRRNGQWRIYDVSVEGISLISNYRTQFNAIIQRASYQELVRRIRGKLG